MDLAHRAPDGAPSRPPSPRSRVVLAALAVLVAPPACADAASPAADTADVAPDVASATDVAPDVDPATDVAPEIVPGVLGTLTPAELALALEAKDFLMIGVHIPYEGQIPGTDLEIPYTDTEALVAAIGPDLDARVVLTCKSSGMSAIAGNALAARGYRAVRHLLGGYLAWQAAGYPFTPP